jgi:type I restriction enzyme S subunit
VNTSAAAKHRLRLYPVDTVVFAKSGMSATKNRVYRLLEPCYVVNHLATIEPGTELDPTFLRYWLEHFDPTTLIQDAAYPSISQEDIGAVAFPLPSLPEQRRIAGMLEQADRLRRTRRYALELSDTFIPATFMEMFGDREGCPVVELFEHADIVSGVAKGQKYGDRKTVRVPYLRVANVQDGHLDLSEIKTIHALPEEVEVLRLQPGDIVMTEGGDFDKLGRGAIWHGSRPDCIHQNHVFRVRLNQTTLMPSFFSAFLRSPAAKNYFLRCSKQTTNLASINMTQLRATPVPLVPLSTQQYFDAIVAAHARLRAQHRESLRQAEHLFQTLLARAFTGDL